MPFPASLSSSNSYFTTISIALSIASAHSFLPSQSPSFATEHTALIVLHDLKNVCPEAINTDNDSLICERSSSLSCRNETRKLWQLDKSTLLFEVFIISLFSVISLKINTLIARHSPVVLAKLHIAMSEYPQGFRDTKHPSQNMIKRLVQLTCSTYYI